MPRSARSLTLLRVQHQDPLPQALPEAVQAAFHQLIQPQLTTSKPQAQ